MKVMLRHILPIFVCAAIGASGASGAERTIDFNLEIKPILADTCYTCHGPDPKSRKAKLRLDTRAGAFAERDGIASIVPGKPQESELYFRITAHDPDERMPPVKSTRKLKKKQINLIRQWIEQGAEWEEKWWAFVPPKRSALPNVRDSKWPRNGLDHHPGCFSYWMAGAGVRPGMTYGETDDYSVNVASDGVHVHDLQATIMHLMGVDHQRLTYKYQGRHFRLTDVHGKIVKPILA